MRAEQQREGSEFGQLIADHIKEGKIVPQEVTIALLRNAMGEAIKTQGAAFNVSEEQRSKWADSKGRFLIDGFPRKMDQALGFDETVSGGPAVGESDRWVGQRILCDDNGHSRLFSCSLASPF